MGSIQVRFFFFINFGTAIMETTVQIRMDSNFVQNETKGCTGQQTPKTEYLTLQKKKERRRNKYERKMKQQKKLDKK